jgi:cephalosporin hydroxylase
MYSIMEMGHKHNAVKKDTMFSRYDALLSPLRREGLKILEIGIFQGGSLKMWEEYFENALIVGLDVDLPQITGCKRIVMHRGRQEDHECLKRISHENAPGGWDIIIDDGSHVAAHVRSSFDCLYVDHLKPGGLYIIEDWGVSYLNGPWEGEPYNNRNHSHGTCVLVKELVDECGYLAILEGNPNANPVIGYSKRNNSIVDWLLVNHDMVVVKRKK